MLQLSLSGPITIRSLCKRYNLRLLSAFAKTSSVRQLPVEGLLERCSEAGLKILNPTFPC